MTVKSQFLKDEGISGFTIVDPVTVPTNASSIDLIDNIPPGVTMVIVHFNEVHAEESPNGVTTQEMKVRIGGDTIVDSGYLSTAAYIPSGASTDVQKRADAFNIFTFNAGGRALTGHMIITLSDVANNGWASSHTMSCSATSTDIIVAGGGYVEIGSSNELTQIQIVGNFSTTAATGSIGVSYQ